MNGIINVLKPPGMTSFEVVSYIRKASGIKKVGHTGTLDPGAAGVLPVCLGKATKIVDYLMNDKKTYIAEIFFGNITDTLDRYGKRLLLSDITACIKLSDFEETLSKYKGEILQKPPAYSALKVNGKRAYELARKGEEVNLNLRKVTIYDIEILNFKPPYAMIKIVCSKGTYIRSLCRDIGSDLGCPSFMNFLLRTSTGNFSLQNSHFLSEINKHTINNVIEKTEKALNMNSVYVDCEFAAKILNGNSVPLKINNIKNNEIVKVFIKPDTFTAIGKIQNGILHVEKLLV